MGSSGAGRPDDGVLTALSERVKVGRPGRAVRRHVADEDHGLGANWRAVKVLGQHLLGSLRFVGTPARTLQGPRTPGEQDTVVVDGRAGRPRREQGTGRHAGPVCTHPAPSLLGVVMLTRVTEVR